MTNGERLYNVLFLCTGNPARSIIAESIRNTHHRNRLRGCSAGSRSRAEVHPQTLSMLGQIGHDTSELRSKSWEEFAGADAPKMDCVFTVCDDAAGETCPIWPGQPMTAHWGVPDPAKVQGNQAEVALAFDRAHAMLNRRIGILASLPIASLDALALKRRLDEIGRAPGRAETDG